jgi:hypothetical protein
LAGKIPRHRHLIHGIPSRHNLGRDSLVELLWNLHHRGHVDKLVVDHLKAGKGPSRIFAQRIDSSTADAAKEIAELLGVSPKPVDIYPSGIRKKLGLNIRSPI